MDVNQRQLVVAVHEHALHIHPLAGAGDAVREDVSADSVQVSSATMLIGRDDFHPGARVNLECVIESLAQRDLVVGRCKLVNPG